MQRAAVSQGSNFLAWMLLLLIVTALLFGWRCYRAGVLAAFGRRPPTWQALARVGIAAGFPSLLCIAWIAIRPEISAWTALGMLHLAASWYGLRWLLPDGLADPPAAPPF
jgi:hypothetical protein